MKFLCYLELDAINLLLTYKYFQNFLSINKLITNKNMNEYIEKSYTHYACDVIPGLKSGLSLYSEKSDFIRL